MELFGVQELASSRSTTAPGWTYLPDTTGNPAAASQSTSRKRTVRKQPVGGGLSDHTAKQDAKIQRDLAALDKESYRDVQIPVPIRHRDNAGRVSHGKVTPAVRKILQSQKTFANHLSDAEALAALAATNPPSLSTPSAPAAALRGSPAPAIAPPRRSHKKKDPNASTATAAATPLRRVSSVGELPAPTPIKPEKPDVIMADAVPTLADPDPGFTAHPGDGDPLLRSRVPGMPSAGEVAELVGAPALTYLEARARLEEGEGPPGPPPRRFCEMCGYWGRVRCGRCGTRVCALECLRMHQEECYARYGA